MGRRLAVIVLAFLSGCANDDVARLDQGTVALVARDFRYEPQNVSVPAGPVRVVLRNAGSQPTSLVIRRGGAEVGRVGTLQPGATGSVSMELAPGEYVLGSATGKHEVLGQRGRLVVRG